MCEGKKLRRSEVVNLGRWKAVGRDRQLGNQAVGRQEALIDCWKARKTEGWKEAASGSRKARKLKEALFVQSLFNLVFDL
jgi:hypothetical protein